MCAIDYCSALHEITSDSVFWKVDNIVALLTIQLSQLLSSYIDLCSTALDHVMSHYLPIGTVHFKIKFRLNDYDDCMSQLPTFVALSSQCSQ